MAGEILLTIITVVRNGGEALRDTLESVARIKTADMEYVVIDGNSTDGTQSTINSFASVIDVYVSAPDRGIYDAMNKAAALAHGRFLLNINVGDTLLRAPLEELRSVDPQASIAAFPVALSSGEVFRPRADWLLHVHNTIHHQGACYRRAALRPYDLAYRTFADFDLNQKLRRSAVVFGSAAPVAFHSAGGQSHDRANFHEVYAIVRKNFGSALVALTWLYFKVQGLRRRIKSRSLSLS